MIVGFSKHGTGNGTGPTKYMTDPKLEGREKSPPVVVKGNADHTRDIIDSLDFKHKYTSGVLSFEHSEKITPEMEKTIIDRFEKMAFAGLEPEQYDCLWVRHTHAKHHELHFVTPRVEMVSGRSMNIRPPGDLAEEQFDDFRSEINARYGLADPDDPARAKTVSIPNHVLKKAAEAIRKGEKPKKDMRTLIDDIMQQRASEGLIKNRDDVLENLKDMDFEIPHEGVNFVTVKDPKSNNRWRLKGELYAREYDFSRTIRAAAQARTRDYSKPDPESARTFSERVEGHIRQRAKYNQKRYGKTEPEHKLELAQEPRPISLDGRVEPLRGFVGRQLGLHAISFEPDKKRKPKARGYEAPKPKVEPINYPSPRNQPFDISLEDFEMWPTRKVVRQSKHKHILWERQQRRKILHHRGKVNDGLGAAIIKRVKDAYERTKQAFQRVGERIGKLTASYQSLATASDQLVRSTRNFDKAVELKQQQMEQKRQRPSPSRGMDFSR